MWLNRKIIANLHATSHTHNRCNTLKNELKILILLIFISSISFGQNRKLTDDEINNSTAIKINFATTDSCSEIDEWYKSDLKKGIIFIFLQGGIAPVEFENDGKFENKYGIYLYDFGCVAPNYKCVKKYNSKVFDYLTLKFGKKWKKEIRKDIIGFKEWKRASRKN